ncbi:GspH/FimT family pseudopilin [Xylophilus sp. GW821-FHT01B05]
MTRRLAPAHHGFTLIELMVTIAIAVILMLVSIPSFLSFKRNSELTSAANALLAGMNTARSEAMKRNLNALVVPLDGSSWESGWRVFVDTDRDNSFSDDDILVATRGALPSYFSLQGVGVASGANPYVLFNGSGYAREKAGGLGGVTLNLTRNDITDASELLNQTRRIKVAVTGRVRVCKPVKSTDANCTDTKEN